MKYLAIFAAVVLAVSATSDIELWKKFKTDHGKTYKDLIEETFRFQNFLSNLKQVKEHNAKYEKGETTYYLGINHFSDLTAKEVEQMFARSKVNKPEKIDGELYKRRNLTAPDSWDWRSQGVVGEIQNQNCGDCWAHGTTGVVEGQYALKYGTLIPLSRQNLIDCTVSYGNFGCDGGYYYTTYNYLQDFGIESETAYPYEGVDANCRQDASKVVTKIDHPVYLPQNDEDALKEAVASVCPIAVYVEATYIVQYAGGVYTDTTCSNRPEDLNHAVLTVGYGTENGQDYWLIKNSWGKDWGEQGYIKLARNYGNLCGVAVDASYVVLP